MDGRRHQRQREDHAGVVDQITRRQAVGAIQHQVVLAEQLAHVGCLELGAVCNDADGRVQRCEALRAGIRLGSAELAGVEQHLALQVGQLDAVAVEESQRSAAGRRQIQGRGGAEAAGPDDEHARRLELLLASRPDLEKRQVTLVALALALRQGHARSILAQARGCQTSRGAAGLRSRGLRGVCFAAGRHGG
jgi:hypothetical protein